MITEALLHRSAERVITYIQRYVTVAGVEKREEVASLFDNIVQLFPHWVIMTCPIMHPEMCYVSKNWNLLFARNPALPNYPLESTFAQVHDDDQQDLLKCLNFVHDALEATLSEQHYHYRSVFYYRFRKPNGQLIHLHDEKAILYVNGSGNLYYSLYRDLTAEKPFSGVKVEMFRQEQSLVKISDYKPSAERSILTKREGELVNLMKQGLSTKEIAWYLNISHNTVRNIKSRLFEKYNVKNMIELLNMTA